mgnify:CR=1 FL=1
MGGGKEGGRQIEEQRKVVGGSEEGREKEVGGRWEGVADRLRGRRNHKFKKYTYLSSTSHLPYRKRFTRP